MKDYFLANGVEHPDAMSTCITGGLIRHLRGESLDLLSIMRADLSWMRKAREDVLVNGEVAQDRSQAVLFDRWDYDGEKRVVRTRLLWHPDDGKVRIENRGAGIRIATDEEIRNLRKDNDHWFFSPADIVILERLRGMQEEKRAAFVGDLDPDVRWKFEKILPGSGG